MMKGLFNRLLKKSKRAQYVMLNWFQHLVKLISYETLNQVQGDKGTLFQHPTKSLKSKCEKLRTLNSEIQRGFTLVEIIVVIVILSIISVITVKFLVDSMRIYTMTVNQKTLFDEGKLALERMCRDIRDARIISDPAAGGSGSMIRFRRTNNTAPSQDVAGEWIRFQLALQPDGTYTLQKVKNDTGPPTADLASNVRNNLTDFTVTRDAGTEIQLYLKLSLTSGENVTLQTKVYPKNLSADPPPYKNFRIREAAGLGGNYASWQEVLSP